MGISIHYRGRLADLTRIEDFEDRVLDLALEVGGLAQIWRSQADDSLRMVRGVVLDLAPGQESTSLLVSPEGWLINLVNIEEAESGKLTEPPWCSVKTQFGPIESHVALAETLTALKAEFIPDLEVSDESGYWDHRDPAELVRNHSFATQAIAGMAEGHKRHGHTGEAADDPEILLRRIERIAAQVHRILKRPAEHPPVEFPDEEDITATPNPETTEAGWDEMFKHNRRQQEQLNRALEERQARGEDEELLENAMRDIGIDVSGDEESGEASKTWSDMDLDMFDESPDSDAEAANIDYESDTDFEDEDDRHPLLELATDLMHEFHDVFRNADKRFDSAVRTLFHGAGDAMGGLAQALSGRRENDSGNVGLRIVQFKRALRGVAFARGALYSLRPMLAAEKVDELFATLSELERYIFAELARVRAELREEES
jgi:hypothetical protein